MGQVEHLRLSKVCELLGLKYRQMFERGGRQQPPRPEKEVPFVSSYFSARRSAIATLALAYPWWGYKRIAVLARREGWEVSDRAVYKILRKLGLLNKPVRSKAEIYQAAKLFELLPQAPNELYQTDVTYIEIPGHGWWYAVTIIDYYSRYLLACHLTPSYSARDCADAMELALQEAERITGQRPKDVKVVTDNGSSFLAKRFRSVLKDYGFEHFRIRYRTPSQLGLLERFHGTLKKEEVYWNLYKSPEHARKCLEEFRQRYNCIRPHWSLIPEAGGDPVTPIDVYTASIECQIPEWQGWAKAAKKKIDEELLMTGT